MRQYVLKRLLLIVPTLLLVSAIVFSLTRMIPGDVVVLMFEEKAYAEDLEALRAKLGLNRPLHVQYGAWLGQVVQGVNLLIASIIVCVNLLVDVTYAYLDPRIRYQ